MAHESPGEMINKPKDTMKTLIKISAALVAVAATGVLSLKSDSGSGAETTWERDSYYVDLIATIPCLGEDVHIFGEVPYTRHMVTTPSGNTSYTYRLPPLSPKGPQFSAVGEISGTVYQYLNGHPLNESFTAAAGETHTFRITEVYRSEDGGQFSGTFAFHTVVNANGELKVDRAEIVDYHCD